VAPIVKPDTIRAWQRQRATEKFDGALRRQSPGRPRVDQALADRVIQIAKANRRWGDDRLAGALAHLGDQHPGNSVPSSAWRACGSRRSARTLLPCWRRDTIGAPQGVIRRTGSRPQHDSKDLRDEG
jgi:hypothetical protein